MLCFNSCQKEALRFVPGDVLFLVHDSVTFNSTIQVFDSLHLKILEMYDFEYLKYGQSSFHDSLVFILRSKPYLKSSGGGRTFALFYSENKFHLDANFFNLDTIGIKDWFNTIQTLNLVENIKSSTYKWGVLSVPIGEEKFWVNTLNRYTIFQSVGLNISN
jgi:hypothetical protein